MRRFEVLKTPEGAQSESCPMSSRGLQHSGNPYLIGT